MAGEIKQKLGFDAQQAINELAKFSEALEKANGSLSKLQASASGAKLNAAAKSLKKVGDEAEKGKKKTQDFTLTWQTMARVVKTQITVGLFQALRRGFTEAIKDAVAFRLSIAEIQTISGDALGSNDALAESVLKLSSSLGKSAGDVAEGLYQTLSNQVVDASEAVGFLETAEKLAIVTHGETKDAVNALSSVMNSYEMSAGDAEHVAGTLFKTVELGRLRLADMADILGRVTPLTSKMGVSWEETAASIAVMTRQGLRADAAITQLRAIMQKIIKPTEAMSAIFRSWGVKDGPAAVKAFGGLEGVLRKLGEETGGSTAEMAKLFRRVRAIVGVMGSMTNEGKDLRDTMDEITHATGAAKDAWDQYSNIDAHKLTVAWTELKNEMIEFGTAMQPLLIGGIALFNGFVGAVQAGGMILRKVWDDSVEGQEHLTKAIEESAKRAAQIRKEQAKIETDAFKQIQSAMAETYAEMNKEEYKLQALRDDRIGTAFAAYKASADAISNYYKKNTEELKKFIDSAADKAVDSADAVADIQTKIEDRQFAQSLEKARTLFQKKRLLNNKLDSQRIKALKELTNLEATEGSRDSALKLLDIAIKTAEKLKSTVKTQREKHKVEGKIQSLMRAQQLVHAKYASEVEKAAEMAKKVQAEQIKDAAKLNKLLKDREDLMSSGDLDNQNKQVNDIANERLKSIDDEIKALTEKGKATEKFLKSIGIDSNLNKVTDGLQAALDKAHFDWEAEVQAAKDVFSKAVIPIRAKLIYADQKEAAASAIGVKQQEGETEADFSVRVSEAALKIAKEELEIRNQIAAEQEKIAGPLDAALKNLETTPDLDVSVMSGRLDQLNEKIKTLGPTYTKAFQINADNLNRMVEPVEFMNNAIKEMVEQVRAGGEPIDEMVQAANDYAQASLEADGLTESRARSYSAILQALKAVAESQKKINSLEKLSAGSVKTDNAEYILNLDKQQVKVKEELKQKTSEATTKEKDLSSAAGEAKSNSQGMANNVAAVGTTAASSTTSMNNLAVATNKAALAAERLAKAQSGGAAATAYHGGPTSFFAAGGLARGNDTIPAMLSRGERVTDARNSRRFASELNAMNQGSQPVYRDQGGPVTNVGDVNVTVNGGDTSSQTVRDIGNALRREIKRGTLKLN